MAKVIAFRAAVNPEAPAAAPRLTKRLAESIKPDLTRDVWAWDAELKGFGLRVMPSGIRTYVVQYRDAGRHTRRLVLGRHGVMHVVTVQLATQFVLNAASTAGFRF